MAPLTIEQIRFLNNLLKEVLEEMPDGTIDAELQNVKTMEGWETIKKIFNNMLKLTTFYDYRPRGMMRQTAGTSPEDNRINYSLALGGLFRSSLIFASKIRLKQKIIENAGNPLTGEGGWYYRNVPVSFDDILQEGPLTRENYYLLIEIFKELNKTWTEGQFKESVESILKGYRLTSFLTPFKNFISQLLSSGTLSYEKFNNIIRDYFWQFRPSGDPRLDGITGLRNMFGAVPGSSEKETENWLRYIAKNFREYDYIHFSQWFVDNFLDYNDQTTVDAVLRYLVDIIAFNPNSFNGEILEQLIFNSIRAPYNIAPNKRNGKSFVSIFTTAMFTIEQYLLRNLPSSSSSSLSRRIEFGQRMELYNLSTRRRRR